MFTRLRTRLTVLYAALFGVVLIVVSVSVFLAIRASALTQVRSEISSTGAAFDRIWSLRAERLHESAGLLSRDFGFKGAVATRDEATIVSAMANLQARIGVDQAFLMSVDGAVVGAQLPDGDVAQLSAAFDTGDEPAGVFTLMGQPYQLVSAPVYTPELVGWIVFAVRLDRQEMTSLERLSAIPLRAVVLHRGKGDSWNPGQTVASRDAGPIRQFIDASLGRDGETPEILSLTGGRTVALAKRLPSMDASGAAVLLLRYPLAKALAPYQPLLALVGVLGLVGMAVVGWGSWALARSITAPITALDEAAQRLQHGEDAQVRIESDDEIGRLAASFNAMATAIRDRERKITQQAMQDGDTGLPNRLALEEEATGSLARRHGPPFVVAMRIDRFNEVRGAIGYRLAAEVVRMVGERLNAMDTRAHAARIASDTVGFLMPAADAESAMAEAERLLVRLEQPVRVGGEAVDVALTLGLAPLEAVPGQAIERASIAVDQARAARRKVALFDGEAYGDPAGNLGLMSSLLAGIERGELELHYQPKLDLRTQRVTGCEALVRWQHPTQGRLPPDRFIPMAEETGHIHALTEWVVRRAIDDQMALAGAGHTLAVAVNISGRTLGVPEFADYVDTAIKDAAGKLIFEITETAIIDNPDAALAMLDRFAAAGIAVSIDDFGVGLSSLAYLKQIRGEELKIDRSLAATVDVSPRDALIVRSTIELAHGLGFKVTAEGVETEPCLTALTGMGCDLAQGYLIARPMPLHELMTYLTQAGGGRRQGSAA
jgi:EAL domain-containing protein (putative c-di-GMP-specific phosphodiesterase class I)/GGDEF domain-containing protein